MARPSTKDEKQLILCSDILNKILMNYLEKDEDILNFILASKTYYEQFYDTLLLHNVLRGGCTALEGAAKTGNKALIEKILEIPIMKTVIPRTKWPRTVDNARDHPDVVEFLLQVDCVQASIDKEARENITKGKYIWEERKFEDSWLRVLWKAIKSDQADVVELLLSRGLTVESCDRDGLTALHIAAGDSEKVSLVRLLLEKYEADPNKMAEDQGPLERTFISPLCVAAEDGNTKVVKLLLEHNADPCAGPAHWIFCQPLAAAITGGHQDIVKILLRDERVELGADDVDWARILNHAVERGNPDVVRVLLEDEQIDPNATIFEGETPLMIAAQGVGFGRKSSGLAMTELLLSDNRVDMFRKDFSGQNALFHAAMRGQHEVLEMYLKDGRLDPNEADLYQRTPVVFTTDGKCLDLLINDTRVDPNKADTRGITPLMNNVSHRLPGNVERLVHSGRVDVNQADYEGNTAMMMAVSLHDSLSRSEATMCRDMVQCLLQSGRVKLDLVNEYGETALMLAVKCGMTHAVKMILATGHRMINIKDAYNVTMIEHAVRNDSKEIVELLLETGEVQVTRGITKTPRSKVIQDMLVRYKDKMEQ
ncbi:putative ankyrin repeat protein [Trichoderma sp. SZMC 28014]